MMPDTRFLVFAHVGHVSKIFGIYKWSHMTVWWKLFNTAEQRIFNIFGNIDGDWQQVPNSLVFLNSANLKALGSIKKKDKNQIIFWRFLIILLQNILSTKEFLTWVGCFGLFTKLKLELDSKAHFLHSFSIKKNFKCKIILVVQVLIQKLLITLRDIQKYVSKFKFRQNWMPGISKLIFNQRLLTW